MRDEVQLTLLEVLHSTYETHEVSGLSEEEKARGRTAIRADGGSCDVEEVLDGFGSGGVGGTEHHLGLRSWRD